jgi:hypothetical protein
VHAGRVIGVQGQNADPESLRVELWLVRSVQGMDDQTVYQTLHATREGAMFAFAPVPVATPKGAIGVQVTGSFSIEGSRLIFVISRRLSYPWAGAQPRDRPQAGGNSGRIVRQMPGPDDVLSFELPGLDAGNGHSAVSDRFSLRVRIRPAGDPSNE